MTYKDIIQKVSIDLNIPPEDVDSIYKGYWRIVRNILEDLPLKEDLSEEEFSKLRTNINIPSLGKMSCTYGRYKSMRDRFKRIKILKNNVNKETD